MNLLLDLGNSRCKFAIVENNVIKKYGVQPYHKTNKLSAIKPLLHEHSNSNKVIICSVLDETFDNQLIELLASHQIHDYYFLDPAVDSFGILLGYQNPNQLGTDRLAAMIAANKKFKGNTCIVDCGTAITIDALNPKGIHQGGVILPSLTSMRQALFVDTDIQHYEADGSFNIVANNTHDAIYTGCLSAVIGGIEHIVNTMQAHYDSFDQIILTGGDAELLIPMLTQQVVYEPNLVLDGLIIVYRNL